MCGFNNPSISPRFPRPELRCDVRRLPQRINPLVALQQAFSHVYQPMVTTYETWGDAGDVHDFVTMVTKFDNFLGFALPWPRCTRHCSV